MGKFPFWSSASKVGACFHNLVVFRTRSNSHSVAVRGGCTNIPLAAGAAQEDETLLNSGFSDHSLIRFVHPDPPGLIRSWKISVTRYALVVRRISLLLPQ